ncbi:hypothetical protein MN116_002281 [Schistosoma mekongi]|uniref:Trematode PH-like domain-containing protein n=1 Tax=Schistosoma mekongi TaxID=38744 RepID=A0AAE1ZJR5_SCHME|nr:hypothetical protein MN116_002281 [Schistosoma mekongi]
MAYCKQNSILLTNELRRQSQLTESKNGGCLHGIKISLINSVVLPPCEIFTESNAIAFIKKYHKIKSIKYKVYLLPDKIVLYNQKHKLNMNPKLCIIYTEVKHIFTSTIILTSGCFVLCIDSQIDNQCRYELYRISDPISYNSFLDLLKYVIGVKTPLQSNNTNNDYLPHHSITYKSDTLKTNKISNSQDESESLFNFESSKSNLSFSHL